MAAVAPMVAMPLKKGRDFLEVQARVQWLWLTIIYWGHCNPKDRIFCFEGDGSIQMNIQELATVHQ